MMMPANYSAIAENEMTYVVGGGLVDVLAPAMTAENWQNVGYNLVQIVGNTYLKAFVNDGFGKVFGGSYKLGDLTSGYFKNMGKIWDNNYQGGKADWALGNALMNTGLQVVGTLASIYTLGSGKVGLKVSMYDGDGDVVAVV